MRDERDPYGFTHALRELGWSDTRLVIAERFLQRLWGWGAFDRATWETCAVALGIPRCHAVHTCFMRAALDIAFIDASGRVIELKRAIGPGRFLSCPTAVSVLERPSV